MAFLLLLLMFFVFVFPKQKHADKIRPARTSHQLEMAHTTNECHTMLNQECTVDKRAVVQTSSLMVCCAGACSSEFPARM